MIRIFFLYFLVFSLFFSCKKDDTSEPISCSDSVIINCENCSKFSLIESKTDFVNPFILYIDFICQDVDSITLNGYLIPYFDTLTISESGYYDYKLYLKDSLVRKQFVLVDPIRGQSDWGLIDWVPTAIEYSDIIKGDVSIIMPNHMISNINVPIVVQTVTNGKLIPNYSKITDPSGIEHNLKRGVGSFNMLMDNTISEFVINVGSNNYSESISLFNSEDFIELKDTILDDIIIEQNQLVYIHEDLYVSSTSNISVGEGCIILLDKGVSIFNEGSFKFNGTSENPIVVTCSSNSTYWGGFVSQGENGFLNAENTFFCRSGYNRGGDFSYGHAGRQALFYTNESFLKLNSCYILDNISQIFYPQYSEIELSNIIVQRAKTGGQINYSKATLKQCVFTDFPDDSDVFRDEDNDAFYVSSNSIVDIDECTFMYAKDDGIDSGSGSGGEINVSNSHFEACFHEGAGLSGNPGKKVQTFTNCVFVNNGQGFELGFGTADIEVTAINCLFSHNYIGIRYGDNYDWGTRKAQLNIIDSKSLYNVKDVWNMNKTNWEPRLENIQFSNTQVSKYQPQYPTLPIYTE